MPQMVYEDVLAHYGVLGMKWGVRKKEPTADERRATAQKDAATKAKRAAKAEKFFIKAKGYDARIKTLQTTVHRSGFARASARREVADLQEAKKDALADAQRKLNGKLSSTQKKLVIGAAVVGTIVAASVISEGIESGNFNRLAMKGKSKLAGSDKILYLKDSALADKTLSVEQVQEKVVKSINPDFGKWGTTQNCRRATFAYEMRRRGYDVMATKTSEANGQTAGGLWNAINPGKRKIPDQGSKVMQEFSRELTTKAKHRAKPLSDTLANGAAGALNRIKGGEAEGPPNAAEMWAALTKQPSGSRGEFSVLWEAGGGHSMVYEIFNGKPVIFDTQSGKRFESAAAFTEAGMDKVLDAGFTRLDNIPLDTDYLAKWVKNAK